MLRLLRGDVDILGGRTTDFQECKLVAHLLSRKARRRSLILFKFFFFQSLANQIPRRRVLLNIFTRSILNMKSTCIAAVALAAAVSAAP